MPFPKLYYPGVAECEKAKTITLKHGESVNNLSVTRSADEYDLLDDQWRSILASKEALPQESES